MAISWTSCGILGYPSPASRDRMMAELRGAAPRTEAEDETGDQSLQLSSLADDFA